MGETGDNLGGMDHMANLTAMITEMQQILQEQQEEIRFLQQQNQGPQGRVGGGGAPPLPPPNTMADCVSRALRAENKVYQSKE